MEALYLMDMPCITFYYCFHMEHMLFLSVSMYLWYFMFWACIVIFYVWVNGVQLIFHDVYIWCSPTFWVHDVKHGSIKSWLVIGVEDSYVSAMYLSQLCTWSMKHYVVLYFIVNHVQSKLESWSMCSSLFYLARRLIVVGRCDTATRREYLFLAPLHA